MTIDNTSKFNRPAITTGTSINITDLEIQLEDEVKITRQNADGSEVVLDITTDYTVNAALNTVTLLVPIDGVIFIKATATINMVFTQKEVYDNFDPFNVKNVEIALDKARLVDKQQEEESDRNIRFIVSSAITSLEVDDPTGGGDKFMKLKSDLSGFDFVTLSALAGLGNIVEDTTPQLGGDLDCNGNQIQWSKGADVASATALAVLTDGNYFDVTGTTTITSINTTGGVGTLIKLHFDGVLTLTHDGSNIILTGVGNITTAAGDEAEFIEYAVGQYLCTNYTKASGEPVVNNIILDLSPQLGGDLDLNGKNIDFPTTANISDCLDEDNMATDSATMLATQQSIKAYVDAEKAPAASDTVAGRIEVAVQSEQETATSTTLAVTPGRQQYHPSASKGWLKVTGGATPAIAVSYNVTSITDTGLGILGITWATDFSSTSNVVTVATQQSTSNTGVSDTVVSSTGTASISHFESDTATDPAGYYIAAFGDQ